MTICLGDVNGRDYDERIVEGSWQAGYKEGYIFKVSLPYNGQYFDYGVYISVVGESYEIQKSSGGGETIRFGQLSKLSEAINKLFGVKARFSCSRPDYGTGADWES